MAVAVASVVQAHVGLAQKMEEVEFVAMLQWQH